MDQYKQDHLNFVHSNGTTLLEVIQVFCISILTMWTSMLLTTTVFNCNSITKTFFIEFLTCVMPLILFLTVLSDYSNHILLLFILTCPILCLFGKTEKKDFVSVEKAAHLPFLTNFRTVVNILSIIAILAVDFQIFPRRFAKTENYGYSLMDFGVGGFVFANGIVAPETKESYAKTSIVKSTKSAWPLMVLGLMRSILVQKLNYNTPVDEYGMHWNFFFTLFLTLIVGGFLVNLSGEKSLLYTGFLVTFLHECFIQAGLGNFVLEHEERVNFFQANKEGLVSLLGYVAIYVFAVGFGRYFRKKYVEIAKILIISISILITSLFLKNFFPPSRKLANLTYVLTVTSIMPLIILSFLIFQKLSNLQTLLITKAINFNPLIFFLIGNLLTGLVNSLIKTREINPALSLLIIINYVLINCVVVTILYLKQIKLKR